MIFLSTAGSDYTALVSQVLIFTLTSSQQQCVEIEILDDQLVEPAEDFLVSLNQSTPQGIMSNQATVTILDGNH